MSEGVLYSWFLCFNVFGDNAGQLPGMPQTLPTVFPGFPFAGTQIGNVNKKTLTILQFI
jgi:hypothetical protein